MCVIIHKPIGETFDRDDLMLAYENNKDGFGYMYHDPDAGILKAGKSTDWTPEQIADAIGHLTDYNAVFHYRYRTKGEIVNSQCHPFKVLDKKRDGVDMYFMHNGTISDAGEQGKESDTQAFNARYLKPLLRSNPNMIYSPAFQHIVEKFISQHSKLVFMFGDGEVIKFNEEQGYERHNCWVSNEYSFRPDYRYPVKNQYVHNKGAAANAGGKKGSTTTHTSQTAMKGTTTGEKSVEYLKTSNVSIGTPMLVFHDTDQSFFSEGEVVEINGSSNVKVKFKNVDGNETQMLFWCSSGDSLSNHGNHKYYAITSESTETKEDDKKTVADDKKDRLGTDETSNVTNLSDVRQNNEKKEESAKDEAKSEDLIEYNGMTIDPYDKYGGAFLASTDDVYGAYSLQDVYEMDPMERFEFFVDHPSESFNMFQDLVEYINILDEEYYENDPMVDYYESHDEADNEVKVLN